MSVKIRVKSIHENAIIPNFKHEEDACADVCSISNYTISPWKREIIQTGLVFEIPKGYEIQVRPRSGMALHHGITILNSPGTIDAGYRGELKVILFNTSEEPYKIKPGDSIAQLSIKKLEEVLFEEVPKDHDLTESTRGEGGFGSTGK